MSKKEQIVGILKQTGEKIKNGAKKVKAKAGTLPIPGWLAGVVTILTCEGLLLLWVAEGISFHRVAVVGLFALGLGCLLGQVLSFIGGYKWGKWATTTILFLITAFYLTEYFVQDFFRVYMTIDTILAGAGGVATGFADVAVGIVLRGLWRILLMLVPVIVYGVFAKPMQTSWRTRWITLTAFLVCYGLGFGLVQSRPTEAEQMGSAYNFDVAVQRFGLHMGLILDATQSSEPEAPEEFEIVEPVPAPVETVPPETEVPGETVVTYEPNITFDFAALSEGTKDRNMKAMHDYVNSLPPTMKNEYTGLFEGKNLIFITAEALSKEAIREDLTPTLYRMMTEGIHFKDFYQPKWGASTTGGEFANLTGMLPLGGGCMSEAVEQDLFLLIGKQLQAKGYHSAAYHPNDSTFYKRNETHTHLGYDYFMGFGSGMEEGVKAKWPQSDREAVDFFLPKHVNETPFSLYFMSVSGHSIYTQKANTQSRNNYDKVKDLPYSEPVKCYLAANLEFEYAMASMVKQLEAAGILEDTVIVISPDHYPYGLEQDSRGDALKELYGFKPKNNMEHDHNALIIWSPCLEDMDIAVEAPVYSLDILPTLLNLFGLDYDSRLLVGQDALSTSERIALWPGFSWKTSEGYYDGLIGEFIPNEGVTVDENYVARIKATVKNRISYSRKVMEMNYFDRLSKVMKKEAAAP